MESFVRLLAPALALCLLTSCATLETELVINADGSGVMMQKADLSPVAYAILLQLKERRPPQPAAFTPVLTEGAAKRWAEANADTGVQVRSFSIKVGEDNSAKVACEIAFADLERFAGSVWGWPLRLGLARTPAGMQLQFSDPARAVMGTIGGETRLLSRPDPVLEDERRRAEYFAMREMARRISQGLRVRTVVHLPAAAVAAEGAALSGDRRRVILETAAAQDGDMLNWLHAPPAKVVLAADAITAKSFAVPVTISATAALKPTTVGARAGFEWRLENAHRSRHSTIDYTRPEAEPAGGQETFMITIGLFGPEIAEVRPLILQGPDNSQVTIARDAEGNDLRREGAGLHFSPFPRGEREAAGEGWRRLGRVSVPLKAPPGGARILAALEGFVTVRHVEEKATLELRPLKNTIGREHHLGENTLKVVGVEGKRVKYEVILAEGEHDLWNALEIRWHGPDGQELQAPGRESRGQGRTHICEVNFGQPFPADGYAVVTYPVKVAAIRIPFAFKDVRLP